MKLTALWLATLSWVTGLGRVFVVNIFFSSSYVSSYSSDLQVQSI